MSLKPRIQGCPFLSQTDPAESLTELIGCNSVQRLTNIAGWRQESSFLLQAFRTQPILKTNQGSAAELVIIFN
jgi:hypothetical protein